MSLQEQAAQAVRWVFSRQHVHTTPEILELACRYRPELSDTLDESGVESVLTLLEKKGELKTMVVFCSDGAQHTVAWNPNARTPSTVATSPPTAALELRSESAVIPQAGQAAVKHGLLVTSKTPVRASGAAAVHFHSAGGLAGAPQENRRHSVGRGPLSTAKKGFKRPDISIQICTPKRQCIATPMSSSKRDIKLKLDEQKESLRKLQLLQTYKEKNEGTRLRELVDKWRDASQQAVGEMMERAPQGCTIPQLLQALHIEAKLLRYNEEDECFE